MTVIVASALCSWEIYLRIKGRAISYDNNEPLWADKRSMVYEASDKSIVFIGSSRIKYDLDIPTWQKKTGIQAIQLAIQGSTPRTILDDLANDAHFKGRLIVDVTDFIFFTNVPFFNVEPNKFLKYYHNHTIAQQASFYLNYVLESNFVFLDNKNLSLNAQLDALQIPSRPGVFMMPTFPVDFDLNTFDRQSYMANSFVKSTDKQNQVKAVWQFLGRGMQGPPMPEAELTGIFESVKKATDKIKARGGDVLFVRTPSSGELLAGENKGFPKEKYWDRLLSTTGCKGIHFTDYTDINHFACPEFSHLAPADAVIYTENLIQILANEKAWIVK